MNTTESSQVAGAVAARDYLEHLLAPIGWQQFVDEYWDKKPLYLESDAEVFEALAEVRRVRELIESGSPWQFRRLPELYLDGNLVPHADLVRDYTDMDDRAARAPILPRIASLLRAGATVNSFGQEAHFAKLADLKKNFARAFAAEVEIALFYSQKDHQGLSPHYDCVEIFVFQISGSKRWYVSSQRVAEPVVGYGTATWYDADKPHATIDLNPGDLLYMPRGTFHQACALSEESLHATVAVKPALYLDMLRTLTCTAPDLDGMRSYLPIGAASAWSEAKPQFLEWVSRAMNEPKYAEALQRLLVTRSGA